MPYAEQQHAAEEIEAYRSWALQPARVPPPQVNRAPVVATDGPLTGTLTLLRAEEVPWNQWTDGAPRLFNNRMAHVFQLELEGAGTLIWRPHDSTLELNSPELSVAAGGSAESILADLSWFALQQERWVLDGDLVARTRAAGPFRDAYLPARAEDALRGVVVFPLVTRDNLAERLGDLQVVAMRVRLMVEHEGELRSLEWVLQ